MNEISANKFIGTNQKHMHTRKRTAHLAGLYYLLLIITGIFALMYVPSKLMVPGDAAATVTNLRASEFLFRLGIVAGLACQVFYLILPLALYRLLKPVDSHKAALMVAFALSGIPIAFIANAYKFDVLNLLGSADYLQALGPEIVQAQIMLALKSYSSAIGVASVFWGLWLLPFGYLVFKSGFLPKILGIFLVAGGIGMLIDFIGSTLWPAGYSASGISAIVSLPSSIGEIGIAFWLLIMGTKEKPPNSRLENPV